MAKLNNVCLCTLDVTARDLALKWNLGLELDEFCTAMYIDDPAEFSIRDAKIRLLGTLPRFFHAPYNELYPCAIDPKIRTVTSDRLNQAYFLAKSYGIKHMVCHGNFLPNVYHPIWFIKQSVLFWKDFLSDKPQDFTLYIENVLEPYPELLRDIVAGIDDPRCKLCFDVGHANVECVSSISVNSWLEVCAPFLGHVHLHNNDHSWDWHSPLGEGSIDMESFIPLLLQLSPDSSVTIENSENSVASIHYLVEHGWL